MNLQIIAVGLFVLGFISILLLTEYLYKTFNIQTEFTRKTGHVLATLSSFIFVFVFDSHWYVFILACIFFLVLYIGKKKHLFNSINSVERKTSGSFLLPVSIYILFYISSSFNSHLLFVLPILILGISDPLAGIFGLVFERKTKKITVFNHTFDKTIIGSLVFFTSSFIISIASLYFYYPMSYSILFLAIIIAGLTSVVEIVSTKGLDNISVPLSTVFILIASLH